MGLGIVLMIAGMAIVWGITPAFIYWKAAPSLRERLLRYPGCLWGMLFGLVVPAVLIVGWLEDAYLAIWMWWYRMRHRGGRA